MVKDVRWLKEKVLELGGIYKEFLEGDDRDTHGNETLPYFRGRKDAFEQVGEMIDELECVDQLELPLIPKYMVEYIESKKEEGATLFSALEDSHTEDIRVAQYLSDVTSEDSKRFNQNKFARAWLDGYKIQVKQYEVMDIYGNYMLYKVSEDQQRAGQIVNSLKEGEKANSLLTKKEIESFDNRYMVFAKKSDRQRHMVKLGI